MFKNIFNWTIRVLAIWGLVVLGIFVYQYTNLKPSDHKPNLYETSETEFKRNQSVVLVKLDKDYSYVQKKSFLRKWLNIPLAAVKYDWHARYQFGIEFSYDWLWLPKFKDNVITIQAPKIHLLDLDIKDKNEPEILNSSIFLNMSKVQKRMLKKRDKMLWQEGQKWEQHPELKQYAQKALGEVFLHFLRQLDLKEDIVEVKVEFND
ncbi:MAG: hypothetical protein GWP59_02090 [Chlamydiales bacterium]|nr:hypothetical protein [Chlamydiales bacterium]